MRKLVLSFAPAALAVIALIACEDESSPGGGDLAFDGGTTPYDGATGYDATVADAPVANAVTVTVAGLADPKSGVRVVFHAVDGSVIETKTTGADGKVAHEGSDAAMVSALLSGNGKRQIVTWTGVEVGDDLQLRDTLDSDVEEPDLVGHYDVTVDGTFADSGADVATVMSPCGGEQVDGTVQVPMYRHCTKAKNALLGTARTFDYQPTGFTFQKSIDGITDGGTSAITLGPWQGATSFDVTVANIPVEPSMTNHLLEIANEHGFEISAGVTTDGYASIHYRIPQGFADAHQATVRFYGNATQRWLTKRVPAATTAIGFDYAALLPQVTEGDVATTDPRRPVLTWVTDGPTTGTDGAIVQYRFSRADESSYRWTFVVPPGAATVTGPAMPPEAEDFLPHPADAGFDGWVQPPEVVLVEADAIPSYAFFRQQQGIMLDYLGGELGSYDFPALPVDGTYRASSWTPNWGLQSRPKKPAPTH